MAKKFRQVRKARGERRLGHSNLGITSVHLHGIDNAEIIGRVRRPATTAWTDRQAG